MPFLHWFRKASRNTETEGRSSSGKKSSPEPSTVSLPASENSGPETVLDAPALEQQSGSLPIPLSTPENSHLRITVAESPGQPAARSPENETPARESLSIETDTAEKEIRVRLEAILSNFPPDLERPAIPALSKTRAEIALPLEVIRSQLADGRVVVSAAMFCSVLPSDLQPYFEAIDPIAEIPIPLREIFLRLPPGFIKLREDQEIDHPAATVLTPFYKEAEEDANGLGQGVPAPPAPGPTPAALVSKNPFKADSERLNALFMTDEVLDLPKTIRMVAELPGLRACLLSTADGLKLAGDLDDQSLEQTISTMVPAVFHQARSKFAGTGLGRLETITLCFSQHQISAFIQGKFCLTVLHDGRPFKPGVREKIQAVTSELAALNTLDQEP